MDEALLATRAQKGDLDAFNQLIFAYQELAFNIAYRILSDEASADDATQTAVISAYKNLKSFRGGSFRAWLMRIVKNACYDELRRLKRHPQVALEPVSSEDGDEIESPKWIEDDSPTPEDAVEMRELDHAVR
jgi:RNA polymerase sigma-70 factor (ECF subfamily)